MWSLMTKTKTQNPKPKTQNPKTRKPESKNMMWSLMTKTKKPKTQNPKPETRKPEKPESKMPTIPGLDHDQDKVMLANQTNLKS